MAYVEYTERPDICALTPLPDGRVKIDLRENIVERTVEMPGEGDTETQVVWSAEEWSLVRYPRRGLEADVRENFDAYLAEAKAEVESAALAAECAAYEREMTKNLAGALLDMDFRLMMLEEMGGSL